jgi:hypothetical protein
MLSSPHKLRRWTGVEFGLGAFLEKIEQRFGKGPLDLLLLLVGLSIAVFCGKFIWSNALGPFVSALAATKFWEMAALAAFGAVGLALGSAIAAFIAGSFVRWREARSYRRSQQEIQDLIAEVKSDRDAEVTRLTGMVEKAEAAMQNAKDAFEDAKRLNSALVALKGPARRRAPKKRES